jgi:hypothetical protein
MSQEQECTSCGEPIKHPPKQKQVKQTPDLIWRQKLIDAGLPVFQRCQKCEADPGRIADSSGEELGRRIRKTVKISSSGLSGSERRKR